MGMDAWKCWRDCLEAPKYSSWGEQQPCPPSSHSLYSSVPFILMSSGHQDSLGALSLTLVWLSPSCLGPSLRPRPAGPAGVGGLGEGGEGGG